jgi:UDP-N-acetylmuramoylalanine--D-glutamate ligase
MQLHSWQGKKVALYGLGKSGMATATALLQAGADVIAWDDGAAARTDSTLHYQDLHQLDWQASGIAALVLSPGISPQHKTVQAATRAGIPLLNDAILFAACQSAARVIGITGTNGKSTTTALIYHLLQQAGKDSLNDSQIGGNFGPPLLSLQDLPPQGTYVLELSSYQLELLDRGLADIAVLLNFSTDHLERHGSMESYVAAKERLFTPIAPTSAATGTALPRPYPPVAVIGVDDPYSIASADRLNLQQPNTQLIRISGRNSTGADLLVQNSWLTGRLLNHQPLIELATLPTLPGEHNAQNIAAAVAVGLQLGLSRDQLCAGLRSFPGLAHRQELIARPADIACINDSKATNAEATAKALACYDNILWIAGGRPKQEDMHELLPLLSRITHAFLIGEGASKFADFLQRRVDYSLCETLPHAVQQAFAMGKKLQESGQATPTILLSPACASFDQYQNFEQRGDHFRQLVITLQTKGQIAA